MCARWVHHKSSCVYQRLIIIILFRPVGYNQNSRIQHNTAAAVVDHQRYVLKLVIPARIRLYYIFRYVTEICEGRGRMRGKMSFGRYLYSPCKSRFRKMRSSDAVCTPRDTNLYYTRVDFTLQSNGAARDTAAKRCVVYA